MCLSESKGQIVYCTIHIDINILFRINSGRDNAVAPVIIEGRKGVKDQDDDDDDDTFIVEEDPSLQNILEMVCILF